MGLQAIARRGYIAYSHLNIAGNTDDNVQTLCPIANVSICRSVLILVQLFRAMTYVFLTPDKRSYCLIGNAGSMTNRADFTRIHWAVTGSVIF